ncbi:hypothetical protein [Halorubrum sp. LN27]|uniref:hypothetical protein n=1 Tax=Halorubrum sp. LN27 TaxID=2801032 RepID=UPI00190DFCDF|nr:hypothetical protein [Halorubrum sp. LN27]
MVEPTYPFPPAENRMSDEQVSAWYNRRLPEREQRKFAFVLETIDERDGDHDDDTIVTVMNHFHTHPEDPVDVREVLQDVGIAFDDPDPDMSHIDLDEVFMP